MRHGRGPGRSAPGRLARRAALSASGHVFRVLGGSAPAASTPHRGARFAFGAMMSIGQ